MKILKTIIGFAGWASYIGLLSVMVYLMVYPPQQVKAQPEPKLIRVTAFCPCQKCCGKWADGYTASGHKITAGDKFCASPQNIPFGTMLDIPGYGVVPVLDRSGSIKEGQIDVFFHTHIEALVWGVRYLRVVTPEKQ